MDTVAQLLPLVLIFAVFWLLVVRPQRRRQQQMTSLQQSLGIGSKIMLTSGIHGSVAGLGDDTIDVEVAPGTVLTVARAAVARVVETDEAHRADDVTGGPDDPRDSGPTSQEPGPTHTSDDS